MPKRITASVYLMFGLIIFIPLGCLLSALLGYSLELISYTGFAIVTAFVSLAVLLLILKSAKPEQSKTIGLILLLMPTVAVLNSVFVLIRSCTIPTTISMAVTIISSCILSGLCEKSSGARAVFRIIGLVAVLV